MPRQLPSVDLLQAFLAVANTGSFGKAGDELNLSQSGVSRQIASLESRLARKLFERHTRRIVLTPDGAALFPWAQQVIGLLSEISLLEPNVGKRISLRAHPTIATRWLIPRLDNLYKLDSKIAVNVDTAYQRFPDFAFESIDAVITFGAATWPNLETLALWEERLIAVCSPALLGENSPSHILSTARLLASNVGGVDWRRWEEAYPSTIGCNNGYLTVDTEDLAMIAAQHGHGVALVDDVLARDSIANGQLIRMHPGSVCTGARYSVVYPARSMKSSGFTEFLSWLESEKNNSTNS